MATFMTSGLAACIIIANDLVAKAHMSFMVRPTILFAKGEEAKKRILDSKEFKKAHSLQMNTAEYAPGMVAMLLYCQAKGIQSPVAATLAVTGSLGYYWIQKIVGNGPIGAPFHIMRFVSIAMLIKTVYDSL
eukprot:CAMPEP_0197603768 /NCGR_PEP_ID=MMETSP1326-20131121/39858_1 /TAXON_ID=1155430 /ORGANISM="Genus nov. species nov., Strain RCC2288" /LENGTH=131 /DNA_ID=CAMNT_0043171323 /DNA_START=58 /DNA_END=453 /DNA_ORIENTATION=+